LPEPAPEAEGVLVVYRYLPLDLPDHWSRRNLTPASPGEPPAVEERVSSPRTSQDTRLQISGSKTFSVEVGSNQDLALDQTLDLTITGRVASNVKVQAILTDRETPLQPEGTTRELEDLDQVFLRVEAPGAQLDLGDLEVRENRFRLASFQRQLEGATGRVRIGSLEGWGVGALTRGQFRQRQFFGDEGRQGPYDLLGPEEEGVVVAGSEIVWLDGARLQRGETEDYIIDYSTGELTFTSRRVMTEQSEVVVDYEVSLEAYRRSLFGISMSAPEPKTGAEVSVLYLREGDDRGQPLGLVISDSEQSLLEDVGDGTSPELDSGIRFVGPGLGDYEKVEVDTLPEAIFRYAGPDSGSYQVSFVDVGAGLGSYADSTLTGGRIFVFVGDGLGGFKPGRPVPRPKTLEVGDVVLSWEREAVRIQAEGAFSRYDENTFSSFDDGDNADGAFDLSGRLRSPTISVSGRSLGHLEARLRARQVGSRYESPGRIREGFSEQEWNAAEGTLDGRERERGVGLDFVSGDRFRVGGDWERLSTWAGFGATRVGTEFTYTGPVRATGQLRRVTSEDEEGRSGERQTERLGLETRRGRLSVRVNYTRERSERGEGVERNGLHFRDIDVTARRGELERGFGLRARVNFRRRWQIRGARETRETDGLTTEIEAGWSRSANLRTRLLLVRRNLTSFGTTPEKTTHLGRLQISQSSWGGALTSQWRAEATSQSMEIRRQEITFVGEGKGHYDAFGRYIGVGDYEVFFQDTGEQQLQSVFDMTGRWTVAPGRDTRSKERGSQGKSLGRRLWRESEWTAYLRSRTESPGDLGPILSDPSRWWGRHGEAVAGRGEIRTDLRLFSRSQRFSPTLRWEIRSRVTRNGETSEEFRDTRSFQIQAVGSPRERLRLEGRQSWSSETLTSRVLLGTGMEDRQRLDRTRTELTTVYRVSRPLRLRLQSARSGERFDDRDRSRTLWEVTPGLVLNLTGGRGELRVRRLWESGEGSGTRIFDLDRPGWTTRATADIKVHSVVDLNLWLEDRRPDEGAKTFTSRVSLRAFF
jgi:hypothetical protein